MDETWNWTESFNYEEVCKAVGAPPRPPESGRVVKAPKEKKTQWKKGDPPNNPSKGEAAAAPAAGLGIRRF